MSEISNLLTSYGHALKLHWQANVSGAEKVWFVVYEPAQERRLRLRLADFATATIDAGKTWHMIDLTDSFATWMAAHEYAEEYFGLPQALATALPQFSVALRTYMIRELTADDVDGNSVVAVVGVGALYGLASTATLVESVSAHVRGRLVVFFPGTYTAHSYHLLGAGAGWNYLAVPITASGG